MWTNNINIELFKIIPSIILFTLKIQFVWHIARNGDYAHGIEGGDLSRIFWNTTYLCLNAKTDYWYTLKD